jgi:hypothetical protein
LQSADDARGRAQTMMGMQGNQGQTRMNLPSYPNPAGVEGNLAGASPQWLA